MSVVRTLIGNVRGPQGATGATGATGAQGEAATIEVGTVTTGAYGTNASVTNSGTEQEAVLDFVIPQGAPGDEVTDASNLTLNEITASSASYPTFTVQEQLKGIFGKIQKFLSDLKNNYVSKSMMTTSTNIDTEGQAVADAKSIKSLHDALATNLQASIVKISKSVSTAHTYTVPSSSRHFVIFACAYNTSYWIGYVHCASAGAVNAYEISKGSQITNVDTPTNTLKFTTGSNTSAVLIDIVCYGDAMS